MAKRERESLVRQHRARSGGLGALCSEIKEEAPHGPGDIRGREYPTHLIRRQPRRARESQLGASKQVLCVTHQPQVAAAGHTQYRVSKAAQDGITQSAVLALDSAGRIEEIARMLGGADVSDEARAAAKKLLEHG